MVILSLCCVINWRFIVPNGRQLDLGWQAVFGLYTLADFGFLIPLQFQEIVHMQAHQPA